VTPSLVFASGCSCSKTQQVAVYIMQTYLMVTAEIGLLDAVYCQCPDIQHVYRQLNSMIFFLKITKDNDKYVAQE